MSAPSGPQRRSRLRCAALLALSLLGSAAGAAAADTCPDPAGAPAEPRRDPAWLRQAQSLSAQAREAAAEVLLIGDSITEWWPPTALPTLLGDRTHLNLGIAGDQTRHLLWRLRQGNLPERPPKAVLLLIGTNDTTNRAAPAEVARGVTAVVATLRERMPSSAILVIGLLPRGGSRDDPYRAANEAADALIRPCVTALGARFIDADGALLDDRSILRPELTTDLLHLSDAGYDALARFLAPAVAAAARRR